jgi:hypothetical protein
MSAIFIKDSTRTGTPTSNISGNQEATINNQAGRRRQRQRPYADRRLQFSDTFSRFGHTHRQGRYLREHIRNSQPAPPRTGATMSTRAAIPLGNEYADLLQAL